MEWGKQNQIWFVYFNETTLNNENMTCMENIFHFLWYMPWNDIYSGLEFHPSHELDCGIINYLLKYMWKETTVDFWEVTIKVSKKATGSLDVIEMDFGISWNSIPNFPMQSAVYCVPSICKWY